MSDVSTEQEKRCGFIAIVGRPNVGKSTLLNYLLEQKISITSRKPQTTRHRVTGIRSEGDTQFIFVDTPGLHKADHKALNRAMNATVLEVLKDVDVVLFMVDRLTFNEEDQMVLDALASIKKPVLLLINKIDLLEQRERLLPHMDRLSKKRDFAEIIPLTVLGGHNLDTVLATVRPHLPASPFLFPEDQVTDRSSRFLAAELIREKITRQLGDELPYEAMVEIERFEINKNSVHIHGLILVEKAGQKQIIIGKDGERLKSIGKAARLDMETAFDRKVMLHLWVKVKSGWADDERALQSLN
ncbi:GTPase Era [Pseudohongiella nitratireducens]|uniref:GTPase Era n=1 Tax=Pseudohongiella nitratireducens TaxID=1768907 RepID=A0A917GK35_9GAMM|nr:GTPase Era [Pseudohongiella nitratireducens]MDF1622794.1 GTPase Era [Pseudohongiella nitratireducens]GGG49131.1 GTPase Era [Pseudohongiella nitratireducens]|tara:strand:+ start:12450 stop:13349 length:900 start_codon:yes stop_codon:yes gene_type:complete